MLKGYGSCSGSCVPGKPDRCQACCANAQCKSGLSCSSTSNKCYTPGCAGVDNTNIPGSHLYGTKWQWLAASRNTPVIFTAPALSDTCSGTISISKVSGLLVQPSLPRALGREAWWIPAPPARPSPPQVTLGLRLAASPNNPIFISINAATSSAPYQPVGVGTNDLKRQTYTVTIPEIAQCAIGRVGIFHCRWVGAACFFQRRPRYPPPAAPLPQPFPLLFMLLPHAAHCFFAASAPALPTP